MMSFDLLEKGLGVGRGRLSVNEKVLATRRHPSRAEFRISCDVAQATGLATCPRYFTYVGKDGDLGWLIIRPTESEQGRRICVSGGGRPGRNPARQQRIVYLPVAFAPRSGTVECEYLIDGGGLKIRLPEDCEYLTGQKS